MKSRILLISGLFFCGYIFGQHINQPFTPPNSSFMNLTFENWYGSDLDGWNTVNYLQNQGDITDGQGQTILPVQEMTNNPIDGSNYVKLTSFHLENCSDTSLHDGDYGALISQNVISSTLYDKVTIDLSYNIQPGDYGLIAIQADSSNYPVKSWQLGLTGSQTTMQTIELPVSYTWGTIANSYSISIETSFSTYVHNPNPSTSGVPKAGSWIAVDNIVFSKSSSAGLFHQSLAKKLQIYPNPSSTKVHFHTVGMKGDQVLLKTVLGNTVKQTKIMSDDFVLDVSHLTQGLYFYSVISPEGRQQKTGKLIVKK